MPHQAYLFRNMKEIVLWTDAVPPSWLISIIVWFHLRFHGKSCYVPAFSLQVIKMLHKPQKIPLNGGCLKEAVMEFDQACVCKASFQRNKPIRSGRFGPALVIWALSVWAVSVWAVSVWPLWSGTDCICFFKWLYRQAECHANWCYTNSILRSHYCDEIWIVIVSLKYLQLIENVDNDSIFLLTITKIICWCWLTVGSWIMFVVF